MSHLCSRYISLAAPQRLFLKSLNPASVSSLSRLVPLYRYRAYQLQFIRNMSTPLTTPATPVEAAAVDMVEAAKRKAAFRAVAEHFNTKTQVRLCAHENLWPRH